VGWQVWHKGLKGRAWEAFQPQSDGDGFEGHGTTTRPRINGTRNGAACTLSERTKAAVGVSRHLFVSKNTRVQARTSAHHKGTLSPSRKLPHIYLHTIAETRRLRLILQLLRRARRLRQHPTSHKRQIHIDRVRPRCGWQHKRHRQKIHNVHDSGHVAGHSYAEGREVYLCRHWGA
jgi:hypothetical protein